MTIDTKRLATDPGYWDEVAPEGAELFVPGSSFEWRKWLGGIEMFFDYEQWLQAIGPWSLSTWLEEKPGCIPRPQKTEVEWDGEGPDAYACPAHCGCLWRDNGDETMSLYGPKSQPCDVCEMEPLKNMVPVRFERTKQQRQRDELALLIGESYGNSGSGIAEAILSRYNLEPKDV